MTPITVSSAPHRKPSPTLRFLVCAIAAATAPQNSQVRITVSRFNAGLSRLFKNASPRACFYSPFTLFNHSRPSSGPIAGPTLFANLHCQH